MCSFVFSPLFVHLLFMMVIFLLLLCTLILECFQCLYFDHYTVILFKTINNQKNKEVFGPCTLGKFANVSKARSQKANVSCVMIVDAMLLMRKDILHSDHIFPNAFYKHKSKSRRHCFCNIHFLSKISVSRKSSRKVNAAGLVRFHEIRSRHVGHATPTTLPKVNIIQHKYIKSNACTTM